MKKMSDWEVLEYTARVRNVFLFAMKYVENLASASALEAGYGARLTDTDEKHLRELIDERQSVVLRLDAFKQELQRLLKVESETEAVARGWELSVRYEAYIGYKPGCAESVTMFEHSRWLDSFRDLLPAEPAALHPNYPVNISPLMPRASAVMQ